MKFYCNFLREKTPAFIGLNLISWGNIPVNRPSTVPKTIWCYWHDQSIDSPTVQHCIERMKEINTGYKVILLNWISVKNYIKDLPEGLQQLQPAHISDYVRLLLLERFGGIYLDASTLITRKLDWVVRELESSQSEVMCYYTDLNTVDKSYPMIENWFLAAIPNSLFIQDWLREYEKCVLSDSPLEYYSNYLNEYSFRFSLNPAYHMCYMSSQIIMRNKQSYRLRLACAEDDGFLYSLKIKAKWSDVSMSEILLMNKFPKSLPNMIKIVNDSRRKLDDCIKSGLYRKYSILGRICDKTSKQH
ncbi:glycosyltransferase family 32 protein [Sphingobacterium corticis]|uniref:Glycosyltransferase family 32 protein n=1 Tax=Sphingobacterium corticis TaxID=1812823 RepID=A0ABW5NJB9_9SPHI